MFLIRRCIHCGSYFDKESLEDENICKNCKKERKKEMGKKRRKNKNQQQKIPVGGKTCAVDDDDVSSESWEVEIDCVTECSKAPEEITVWMKPLVKEQIEALMKEYSNIEWLAYLIGEWKDSKTPLVKELFIPEQKVSSASVNNIRCPEHNDLNVIGVIHSHHTMGHSFSQVDADWINQNHNISLVVSHSGMDGQVRFKTPCGSLMTVKAKTKLWYDIDFDSKDFIKKAKEKIKRYTATNNYAGGYGGYGGGYYDNGKWTQGQKSYMNGKSVKPDWKNDESSEPDVDDINNNDAAAKAKAEDEAWEVNVNIKEDETLKDALIAYEKEITKEETDKTLEDIAKDLS